MVVSKSMLSIKTFAPVKSSLLWQLNYMELTGLSQIIEGGTNHLQLFGIIPDLKHLHLAICHFLLSYLKTTTNIDHSIG